MYTEIKHRWGGLSVGQQRIQAGSNSFYLNSAFDRGFWDRGLIFDFIFRGIISNINIGKDEIDLFMGSDQSSSMIGGGRYIFNGITGLKLSTSALYIARDPQYSAFGYQLGLEVEENYGRFWGYQVVAYKIFDQEPSAFEEMTLFSEERFDINDEWTIGTAGYYKRLFDLIYKGEEVRLSIDAGYRTSDLLKYGLQTEYFKITGYKELHLGFFLELKYFKGIKIIPRLRYIINDLGPNAGFIGVESVIIFDGKK
jgi:hypothetical protein